MPAGRFAFTDRTLTRVVEPGEVLVWAAAHAAATAPAADLAGTTGGAISNERTREQVVLPGAATTPSRMVLTGDVHRVTGADRRVVTVEMSQGVLA